MAMQPLRDVLRAHLHGILPLALVVVTGVLGLAVLAGLYAALVGATSYQAIVDQIDSPQSLLVSALAVVLPIVLLAVFAGLVWAGTAVQLASAQYDHRKASTRVAVWTSVKRAPRALAVVLATVGAVLGLVVATPVLVVVGIAGLITKRGSDNLAKAIPLGFALLTLLRWVLALPAVWIDGLGVTSALRESTKRVEGQKPRTALTVISTTVVTAVATEGLALLVPDPTAQLGVRILALIGLGGLPFAALAVLYRQGSAERPEPLAPPLSRRARLALAVTLSLLVPFAVTTSPSSAQAAPVTTVTLSAYATETLVGQNFLVESYITGATPTGDVAIVAIPDAGAEIALGAYVLDPTGHIVDTVGGALPAGDYTLVARYVGDANNPATASTPLAHTVSPPSADIAVTSSTPTVGDTTTITVTVTPHSPATTTPAGTVTIGGSAPLTLDGSGVATLAVDMAAQPSRELTVSYAGDYPAKSVLYTVPRIPTTTTSTTVDFGAEYGDSLTLTGYVSGGSGLTPTGTVSVLWLGSLAGSGTLNASGGFSITTDELPAGTGTLAFFYEGDATHAPSDTLGSRVQGDIGEAVSVPVVSVLSADPRIGVTTKLVATMSDLGVGPTGLVTFYSSTGAELGSARPVHGVASIDYLPTQASLQFMASFAGDTNYLARDSALLSVGFGAAPVTVTLDDPGPLTIGQVVTLTAHVTVGDGGVTPTQKVNFDIAGGGTIATDVLVSHAGTASISVCAGEHGDCPAGTIPLGRNDLSLTATYGAGPINLAATSAALAYTPGDAPTTTTLDVNPNPVLFGSAVFLTATVAAPGTSATPTGVVSFYGVEPGGGAVFLGSDALVNGVARVETRSGTGVTDLRWPADSIRAEYDPDGAPFVSSASTVGLLGLGRIGVTVTANAVVGAAGTPSKITVLLQHDPGASDDFTGHVVVTADNTSTCTVYVPAGANTVNCSITWSSVGTHTFTADYSGDGVYLPGTSGTVTVDSTRPAPVLGATAPTDAMADTDVTVTWSRFDPTASGTVIVYADGAKWCEVDVQVLGCTGRFGVSSATGGFVDVLVRYSGDPDWLPLDQISHVSVSRCATLDVYPSSASLGTVSIATAPNCGATGYLPGTTVSITATAKPGAEFLHWLGWTPTNPLAPVSAAAATTFVPTNDPGTWVREARFRASCYPVTAFAMGSGGISVYPAANCTTDAGVAGYLRGTDVVVYPDGHYNPFYDEPDAFWSFGPPPPGGVIGTDRAGRPLMRLTVTGTATVRVYFGPVCRDVTVAFSPASEGDAADATPPHNCSSPSGGGYLRYTPVTLHAVPGDPSMAITGWTLNGAPAPELGTTSDPTVVVDDVAPVLVAAVVHCYAVDVAIDGVTDRNGLTTGDVRVDGTACPDGSDRYLGGTKVTLTPVVLAPGTRFNGWDDQRITPVGPASGDTGEVVREARTITLDRDLRITAGFYDKDACSSLGYLGDRSLMSFTVTGCGPGYYLDTRRQQAALQGVSPSELTGAKYYGIIDAEFHDVSPLHTYVMVKGDVVGCPYVSNQDGGWLYWGEATGSRFECRGSGAVTVWAASCQSVETTPVFTVKGRPETYDASVLPDVVYTQGSDGVVRGYSMTGFQWAQGVPVLQRANGTLQMQNRDDSPCSNAGENVHEPDTDLLLYAAAPSSAFRFTGWSGVGSGATITQNPIRRITTSTQAALTATASFTITCHKVTLGEGITIDGDAARCPGTSAADNMFIDGTAIPVRAQFMKGDRSIQKFEKGVVGGQIWEDPMTLDLMGYVYVGGDVTVTALWQNRAERETTAAIKGLKTGAGIVAVVLPVAIGVLLPPAGIFFAAVGSLATITSFIPGAENVAAVFDLINPTKITACVARWGFDSSGSPSVQSSGALLSSANTVRKVVFTNTDVVTEGLGPVGAAGGALSIGYGLYDAGLGSADLSGPESLDELAGRSTIAGCLDDVWRVTGSEVGESGSPAG